MVVFAATPALAAAGFPELRDRHSSEFQAALDEALVTEPIYLAKVRNKTAGGVVVDVSDPKKPLVAWYNPELMMYAASLPKIAIVFGAFVEMEADRLQLDDELHRQLVGLVKVSSNRDATTVLNKVGIARLADILQDPKHGKLYDPAYGGGLWVGKAYDKSPVWKRDPIHGISHGASAMSAARLYYGMMTGTLLDRKHLPLLAEIFGKPRLQHKFVKGLKGREREIYRKSGTWRNYHADSGVIVQPDGSTYIMVVIGQGTEHGRAIENVIRIVDDLMEEAAASRP